MIELLVVLGIIGMLTAITLPAIKGIRQTNTMVSAGRQLVDDIALARARAIGERTTVHMIFVPPEIFSFAFSADPRDNKLGQRLKSSPFTSYALYAERTVGDQPGHPRARFLTEWRTLPDGVFIDTNKFVNSTALFNTANDYARPFEYDTLPFPTINGKTFPLPQLAFDAQGRLVNASNQPRLQSEVIELTRGSIWPVLDAGGAVVSIDVREMPRGNSTSNWHRVVVDGLTGRARVETPSIQ